MRYICGYQAEWARSFQELSDYLSRCVSPCNKIHHVGSTSIAGMPAKDIIDITIATPSGQMSQLVEELVQAGYHHNGDQGIPGREAFHPNEGTPAANLAAHHLYACEAGAEELHRHLSFRNYLRAHPARAQWLANQKIQCDAQAATRSEYIELKAASYTRILEEALQWASA